MDLHDLPQTPLLPPRLAKAFCGIEDCLPIALMEEHPRILDRLEPLWGTREAMPYLHSLLFTDRIDRVGFGEEVIAEVMLLSQLHQQFFPEQSKDPHDAYHAVAVDHGQIDLGLLRKVAGAGRRRTSGTSLADLQSAPALPRPTLDCRQAETAQQFATGEDLVARGWPEITDPEELRHLVDLRAKRILSTFPRDTRRLGEILLATASVDPEALEQALARHRQRNGRRESLGRLLVEMGAASEDDVMRAACVQAGIPLVDLSRFPISQDAMKLIPIGVARQKGAVPVAVIGNTLFLAVSNPLSCPDRGYFAMVAKREVELMYAAPEQVHRRLESYGQSASAREGDAQFRDLARKTMNRLGAPANNPAPAPPAADVRVTEDDATIVGLVNKMIGDAITMKVSDIHVEAFPGNHGTRIRFRRDGRLEPYSEFPSAYHEAVVSRIKIVAGLDITERRRGQDGKIAFPSTPGNRPVDLRVATIPTVRGIENITIRILAFGEPMRLDEIGLSQANLVNVRALAERPHGLFVVCGPTGSGKTTTLHSVLRELNREDRKIWTVEDPVEILQKDICQVQVNPKAGWTFAAALRSLLRADPDVIMMGEMRDQETAKIALEASMTGHLVLSTLHTNSASETASRLLDLGMDPFVLSDSIAGILAQRLARQLCPKCKSSREYTQSELDALAAEYFHSGMQRTPSFAERDAIIADWRQRSGADGKLLLRAPQGCAACFGTGYSGRLGLHELMPAGAAIRELIRNQAPAASLREAAIAEGMRTLKQDGIEKVLLGATTLMEVRSASL